MQTLKQLIESTTGSENLLGTILNHPKHGRAVLIEIDRRNNSCCVWHERQHDGYGGFRNILYSQAEYTVAHEASFEKAQKAMEFFLS